VAPPEYSRLQDLCIFLIAALLPSDALIRFGRARFMRDATGDPGNQRRKEDFPNSMPATTLPQVLAFASFVVVCLIAIPNWFSTAHVIDIARVDSYLIAALLPSEAVVRFGRAHWLKAVPANQISDEALKRI
jgi:hypothetical protein